MADFPDDASFVLICIVQACVTGMFTTTEFSAFKQHLRDFLVQTKAFADSGDNAALFAEETAVQQEVRRLLCCAVFRLVLVTFKGLFLNE